MRVGIVSASQLSDADRWDSEFHLLWRARREAVEALRSKHDKSALIALARRLPFDKEAARIVAGSPRGSRATTADQVADRLTKDSINPLAAAVYVAAALASAPARLLEWERELEDRVNELDRYRAAVTALEKEVNPETPVGE